MADSDVVLEVVHAVKALGVKVSLLPRLWRKGARLVPRKGIPPHAIAKTALASGERRDYIGTTPYAGERESGRLQTRSGPVKVGI